MFTINSVKQTWRPEPNKDSITIVTDFSVHFDTGGIKIMVTFNGEQAARPAVIIPTESVVCYALKNDSDFAAKFTRRLMDQMSEIQHAGA